MKILSADQIRSLDQYTIDQESILSIELMERASQCFVDAFLNANDCNNAQVGIICGPGNNGGDGLAIARLLSNQGISVKVCRIKSTRYSSDNEENFKRLKRSIPCHDIDQIEDLKVVDQCTHLIDAIFGSGLNKRPEGIYKEVIQYMTEVTAKVIAIDIPSGMYCDQIVDDTTIVSADQTITFQVPKKSFFYPESAPYLGKWQVIDMGLSTSYLEELETQDFYLIDQIIPKIKLRDSHAHKGTYGHALLIGGSYGMMGAVQLASKACLRSGVGLTTVYMPRCGYEIIQSTIPEAMVSTSKGQDYLIDLPDLESYTAIGIGPGLSQQVDSDVIKCLFEQASQPLVIDADALNLIAGPTGLCDDLPKNSILTPHPKEFQRLFGGTMKRYEQIELAKEMALKYQIYIVLKGAHTAIISPEKEVFYNSTGNAGMATGGSGDVLTGLITGLLAQGYASKEAALLGVYLHGKAGDQAYDARGYSLLASDIIEAIKIKGVLS